MHATLPRMAFTALVILGLFPLATKKALDGVKARKVYSSSSSP
jgi:hypothetical protein